MSPRLGAFAAKYGRLYTAMMNNSADERGAFWTPQGRIPRATFILRVVIVAVLGGAVQFANGGREIESLAAALALVALASLSIFHVVQRGRDAGWPWWAAVIAAILLNAIAYIVLMIWPSKAD